MMMTRIVSNLWAQNFKRFVLSAGCALGILVYLHQNTYYSSSCDLRTFACLELRQVPQDDPNLICYMRKNIFVTPTGKGYNLTHPRREDASQFKQGIFLRNFFRDKRNGTFIEAGAWDGELFSNTLILERQLGWTGLLIEPNPQRYPAILTKHRKAYSSNTCISLRQTPQQLNVSLDEQVSHIVGYYDDEIPKRMATVECFPIYSFMAAMNITTLDLLSLDLESLEVKVLKTIPWEKVNIKTLLIEVNHIPEGKEFLRNYMEQRNYVMEKELDIDYFFVKKS